MLQPCSINGSGSKKKCIRGLWDGNIPTELLQEILSRVGLKTNIVASLVCKTWFGLAVGVRKLRPRPWLFYPLDDRIHKIPLPLGYQNSEAPTDTYILLDPSRFRTYKKLKFPEFKKHRFVSYKDGWLLVLPDYTCPSLILFLNPFTEERIYLPCGFSSDLLAFSAAPTSTSCLVISLTSRLIPLIQTWRPGATLWTTDRFDNQNKNQNHSLRIGEWDTCVFSNGMFYCLSDCGYLGVFDPHRATWNILSVKPCHSFSSISTVGRRVLMVEHEGDIFVVFTRHSDKPTVFKLNTEQNVWQEKTELGGLTMFVSNPTSLTIAGLSLKDRNRIYPSHQGQIGVCYSFVERFCDPHPPTTSYLSDRIAWLDPPRNIG